MKAKRPGRFDLDAIRRQAVGKTFERGKEYFDDGCVEILSLEPRRVVALVAGTRDYRTIVSGDENGVGGECSCPAFGDWGFCKHMVAAALAANAAGDDNEAEGALPRVREHLQARSKDQLVNMLVELAELQPELLRKLSTQATMASADDATIERRLKADIEKATRVDYYLDYRRAEGWRNEVDAVLTAVADITTGPRAALALKLVDQAIERIGGVFESIDDSDGHLGSLLARAGEIHLAAARGARPEPVAFARDLFKREMRDDLGTFSGSVVDYADVLGEQGQAEYRRLATAAWEKLHGSRLRKDSDDMGSVAQLKAILDFFAERDGDVEARIALRSKDLSSQWDYLQLAEFCLSQGREEEALRRTEEGLWLFEDGRPDERLLFFAVKLLTRTRRKADAEAHLWRAFEKAPSLDIYKQLRKIGGESIAARALAALESRLFGNKGSDWRDRPDLLVEILMHDKRFDAAWSAVRKYGASVYAKEELVEATDIQYPREALEFYAVQVEQLAASGSYAEAVKRIARMAKLRSPLEQAAFVTDLKVRHGRKRNFMKLLG